ncbi:hypothetical protein B0H63DRAFT_517125 [Podospora didyma]|uniref:Uncharacterized protein n=1 Tax=Podospora didyma TaxID=330526 RepID=A0AAE0P6N1_9PEZI|nr:hypothetical protein B0H63DRAFT_517125 [Podospora didyma]
MASPAPSPLAALNAIRSVYLAAFLPSPMFPAHWGMWIPNALDQAVGTLINVRGDPCNGFVHEFERGYRAHDCESRPLLRPLGTAADFPDGPTVPGIDTNPCNDLERLALSIPPPALSLTPAGSSQRRFRVAIKNCQTWLRQLVDAMIEKGLIDPSAKDILDASPQH